MKNIYILKKNKKKLNSSKGNSMIAHTNPNSGDNLKWFQQGKASVRSTWKLSLEVILCDAPRPSCMHLDPRGKRLDPQGKRLHSQGTHLDPEVSISTPKVKISDTKVRISTTSYASQPQNVNI